MGAPTWPPSPRTLGAPRPSRGAPRQRSARAVLYRAILYMGELARIELEPDRLVHLEHLVRAGGDAQLERAVLGPHRVVPVLTEVRALHDPAGDRAGALAGGRPPAVQVDALRAQRERHAAAQCGRLGEERPRQCEVVEDDLLAAHVA